MQPLYCRIQLLFYLAAFHPILVLQRFSVVVVAEDSSSSSVVWDKYAISPRKCIYFNNQDVIIYSMFDNGNTVCNGQAAGLYYTDVSTFVSSYLEQQQQDAQISGSSYQEPSVASYLTCTLHEQNGQNVYSQLGCSKSSVHNLTVNLYSDSTCTTRVPYSSDTISVDLSDFSIPFKTCESCVNWFDVDDNSVDDQFYSKHKLESPLCYSLTMAGKVCKDQCRIISQDAVPKEDWSTSDKFILGFLSLFGIILVIGIIMQRQLMSKKDSLMEEAAMAVAGIQKVHIVGLTILFVIIIMIFGLLRMKAVTWTMLLLINLVLFLYLVKLLIPSVTEDHRTIGTKLTSDTSYSEFSTTASVA